MKHSDPGRTQRKGTRMRKIIGALTFAAIIAAQILASPAAQAAAGHATHVRM